MFDTEHIAETKKLVVAALAQKAKQAPAPAPPAASGPSKAKQQDAGTRATSRTAKDLRRSKKASGAPSAGPSSMRGGTSMEVDDGTESDSDLTSVNSYEGYNQ